MVFASLGDLINHLTINVTDQNNLFDTETVVITTPDMSTYRDVVQALDTNEFEKMGYKNVKGMLIYLPSLETIIF